MRQRYAYGSNIAAVRCGWENRIMSNGESKIVIFKAALCCGFAIALRALFLGILYKCLSVIARGASLAAINEQRIPVRLIATLTLAMTKIAHAKFSIVMLSETKHCIIASECNERGNQPCAKLES